MRCSQAAFIIRSWKHTISPVRLQLQPQLQVHDAPLSLADLTRIAVDGGERVSDADAQVTHAAEVMRVGD